MSRMAILVALCSLSLAAPAVAQEGEEPAVPIGGEDAVPVGGEAEAQAAARSGPLSIAIAVVPGRRVDAELVSAVDAALAEQLAPYAQGRPIAQLNAQAAIYENLSGCDEDACLGNQLAVANAQVGVIARLERGRRDLRVTIEIRDPVSGALRGEAISGSVPRDAATLAEALGALSAQVEVALPPPPPPPATLLVSVNVDGARVTIDDADAGLSPIAAVEVEPGEHVVVVMAQGYASARRTTQVQPGQQARLDVTVREIGAEAAAQAGVQSDAAAADPNNAWAQPADSGSGDITGEWWFWTIIGGGAALLIGIAIGVGVAVGSQPGAPAQPEGIPLPRIEGGI